jgi:rubredoxin
MEIGPTLNNQDDKVFSVDYRKLSPALVTRLKTVEVGCIVLQCCHPDTVEQGNATPFDASTATPVLAVSVVTPEAGWLQLFVSRDDAVDLLNNSPFFEEYLKIAPHKPVKKVKEEKEAAPWPEKDASGGAAEVRPGDWTCPNCSSNVFGKKSFCFKCKAPKPAEDKPVGETAAMAETTE